MIRLIKNIPRNLMTSIRQGHLLNWVLFWIIINSWEYECMCGWVRAQERERERERERKRERERETDKAKLEEWQIYQKVSTGSKYSNPKNYNPIFRIFCSNFLEELKRISFLSRKNPLMTLSKQLSLQWRLFWFLTSWKYIWRHVLKSHFLCPLLC